jgi:hypothetical protein
MGICWYCYWGWAEQVADIHDRAEEELGESAVHYGPAHIVFADENFEDGHIEWCITECDKVEEYENVDVDSAKRLKSYLEELLAVPEEVRCCCPEDYDGENPVLFPPTIPVRHPGKLK